MPSAVHQLQQSRNLRLTYAGEDGRLAEDTFDLLVLAVGFAPPPGAQELARHLGLDLNDYGFALTGGYHPSRTQRPGVFVAGAFREPKDIPETVAEAAGAAADLAAFLHGTMGDEGQRTEERQTMPAARDVSDEEPRVGVFVCECNGELAALRPAEVVAWAQRLPGVALAQQVPLGCSAEGQATIQAAIEAQQLNRVVLAGCSPRLFGTEFEALMRRAGLDPRLLGRVNLREQVLYPHTPPLSPAGAGGNGNGNGALLTAKAQSLVGMAVAGLKTMAGLEALARGDRRPLTRRALVLGGGAAGLTAALTLARLDIPVHLVEREPHLGGQWRHLHSQPDGSDPQQALHDLLAQVQADPRVTLHLGAELRQLDGTLGHYRSTLAHNGQEQTVEHGVLVVATGGHPAPTSEYLYGQQPRVVTQRELEQQLAQPTLPPALDQAQTVVMIQCVGSREPQRPYCSRVCCTQAVKNALRLKALKPTLNIYLLYREVRTYGFREALYQAARDAGVVFLRYDLPHKPVVSASPSHAEGSAGRLWVTLTEPVAGQPLELHADLLVLSVGIEPEPHSPLAHTLGVALNAGGFFLEEHPKMKPLDLMLVSGANKAARGGLYVAGLAHSPRFLDETIAQAQGAAMRAAAFLAPEVVSDRPTAVWVNERWCSFCGLCVESCPFQARVMNYETRVADVDYALCQGCGVCAMVCPNKATLQKSLEHKQLMAAIDMALG
jgi:heterodisulfide reductase subunit A